jgi:putative transposase
MEERFIKVKGNLYHLTPKQEQFLNQASGNCRFVWNFFQDMQEKRKTIAIPFLSYAEMCKLLTQLKKEKEFLNSTPALTLQQVLRDLDKSIKKYTKDQGNTYLKEDEKARFPKKHKKYKKESFRLMQQQQPGRTRIVKRKSLYVSKEIGHLPVHLRQKLQGTVVHATLIKRADGWKVSICCRIVDQAKTVKKILILLV